MMTKAEGGVLRVWQRIVLAGLISLIIPASTAAAILSQGFKASGQVSPGMLVSLSSSGSVEAADTNNGNNLHGVVVEEDSAAVAIKTAEENQVQVATSGLAAVLVSDINGAVKKGDPITVSPLKGVGMKVGDKESVKIIGIAQADASGGTSETVEGNGKSQEVTITRVPAMVAVSLHAAKSNPLTTLQQASTNLAGKPVSTTKALLAALILLVSILSVSVLLYTAIRSSLISIGRNPLSESAVRQELLRVLLVAPLILGAALVLIYALLRS